MSHLTHFPTVYPDLNKSPELIHRGAPKLLSADVRAIIAIVGTDTIISHICQHAIKHAAEYIRSNNLTLADYTLFAEYLRQRSAPPPTPTQTSAPHVAGRNPGGSKQTPDAARKRPVLRKDVASGGR